MFFFGLLLLVLSTSEIPYDIEAARMSARQIDP